MTASPDTLHYIRLQLLQLLAENPHMSQRDLSRKMGVALGRVNYCLRPTVRFLKRRLKEYEEIKTQIHDLTRDVAQADPTLLDDPDLQPPFKP